MNAEQRRPLAETSRLEPLLTMGHLLLLNPNADTHFTIPQRAESYIDLGGWLHSEMVYPPPSQNKPAMT